MIARRHCQLRGVVQGVGFRPFVARLAREMKLGGHVINTSGWVEIEIEGPEEELERFRRRIVDELPTPAQVDSMCWRSTAPLGQEFFRIDASAQGEPGLAIPPDLAPCAACSDEVRDPTSRRSEYPFTNCTHCGPRFTVAKEPPYDRARTSMASFAM